MYVLLADLVLMVHFMFVGFVVVGFLMIWVGYFLNWQWVRNFYFRVSHLAAIGVVVLESVIGKMCPLTLWEHQLRLRAGEGRFYEETFMQHWLHRILFLQLSEGAFLVLYVLFFILVVLSIWFVKPRWPNGNATNKNYFSKS
jgi:hypothetical protein